ncbi:MULTISPECIES: hypothetical protein [Halolamina]|uniref:Uncharacterized protein n=1 Tax=Halolamina pelagica TaxID=699431 RepID=A0A1I5UVX8_9EURY|nr:MULTISPECIES: hypothetical protein [Halolamina]NHX36847.1 hypothetical protein [Halolamina sp. R1-12]SFP99484.1 hypothetical protein SAMN05216277_1154 [Halolamina pelagica]
MADKQFTFFELHFHDGFQVGPRSLPGGDEPTDDDTTTTETTTADTSTTTEESTEDSGPSLLAPLVGLGALAALAYAVRKLLAGVEPEGLDALDDIEEQVDEATEELEAEAEDSVPIEITSPEEQTGGRTGLVVAAVVGLLLALAVAAYKLLTGSEEIVVEE